ncbi:hypothetical protein L9F63_017193, partial [Diploptera punctata]
LRKSPVNGRPCTNFTARVRKEKYLILIVSERQEFIISNTLIFPTFVTTQYSNIRIHLGIVNPSPGRNVEEPAMAISTLFLQLKSPDECVPVLFYNGQMDEKKKQPQTNHDPYITNTSVMAGYSKCSDDGDPNKVEDLDFNSDDSVKDSDFQPENISTREAESFTDEDSHLMINYYKPIGKNVLKSIEASATMIIGSYIYIYISSLITINPPKTHRVREEEKGKPRECASAEEAYSAKRHDKEDAKLEEKVEIRLLRAYISSFHSCHRTLVTTYKKYTINS